jgi:hypothetical protein
MHIRSRTAGLLLLLLLAAAVVRAVSAPRQCRFRLPAERARRPGSVTAPQEAVT